jgi:hypothetical protein
LKCSALLSSLRRFSLHPIPLGYDRTIVRAGQYHQFIWFPISRD